MVRSQRILVVEADCDDDEATQIAKNNDCVAFLRGIPLTLRGIAIAESWTLPHVWTETWDDSAS